MTTRPSTDDDNRRFVDAAVEMGSAAIAASPYGTDIMLIFAIALGRITAYLAEQRYVVDGKDGAQSDPADLIDAIATDAKRIALIAQHPSTDWRM